MKVLADHNVKNWVTVIKGASAILCVILCESSSASVREHAANKALTESIFNCAKESSNHTWSLENGKSLIFTTAAILTCHLSAMDSSRGEDDAL